LETSADYCLRENRECECLTENEKEAMRLFSYLKCVLLVLSAMYFCNICLHLLLINKSTATNVKELCPFLVHVIIFLDMYS
jgi:hypothetical protein